MCRAAEPLVEVERLIVLEHLDGEEPPAPDPEQVTLANGSARLRQFDPGNEGTEAARTWHDLEGTLVAEEQER